jgi:hypothetical protein
MPVGHKLGKDLDGTLLLSGRREAKGIPDAIFQFVSNHCACKSRPFFLNFQISPLKI